MTQGIGRKAQAFGADAIRPQESRLPANARSGECMQGAYKVAALP
jgi:hypothetical protein